MTMINWVNVFRTSWLVNILCTHLLYPNHLFILLLVSGQLGNLFSAPLCQLIEGWFWLCVSKVCDVCWTICCLRLRRHSLSYCWLFHGCPLTGFYFIVSLLILIEGWLNFGFASGRLFRQYCTSSLASIFNRDNMCWIVTSVVTPRVSATATAMCLSTKANGFWNRIREIRLLRIQPQFLQARSSLVQLFALLLSNTLPSALTPHCGPVL